LFFIYSQALSWANNNCDNVLNVYCFDPREITAGTYKYDFPKCGIHRLKFLIETVICLKTLLEEKGSNLFVQREIPEIVILNLVQKFKQHYSITIIFHQEVTREETDVEAAIRKVAIEHKVNVKEFWGLTLFHPNDLPYTSPKFFPDVYTTFRTMLETKNIRVRKLIDCSQQLKPLPDNIEILQVPNLSDFGHSVAEIHAKTVFPFSGGETSALNRLQSYVWTKDLVQSYKKTRNSLVNVDHTTKFSAWLSNGSLSPRKIYFEIKRYEKECGINDAGYWIIFEIIWRDFFRFIATKYGNRIFYPSGLSNKKYVWKQDVNLFEKWRTGHTGCPFVDANMREMLLTGWQSNRGRQNVASYLTKDLQLDWQYGAEWFESILIDYDVCSNYGNWIYQAGVGNDPREYRHFNMIKQAFDYDPEGEFVRTWIPELAKLPNDLIHTPWLASSIELKQANVELGVTYPRPIMIVPQWNNRVRSNVNYICFIILG
ncbi:unnamed protein product, partial [Didymodactylos carnosus]